MKITLDPGHSGPFEPGACAGGFTEAEFVLSISEILEGLLVKSGHEVLMTRTGDIMTDDLSFRAQVANVQLADIFISIHCNASDNQAATGCEVYHFPGSVRGAYLADCIRQRIIAATGLANRGTKAARFQVLRDTSCPAVLVELAFISCAEDRRLLASAAGQIQFAAAIFSGVQDFCGPV